MVFSIMVFDKRTFSGLNVAKYEAQTMQEAKEYFKKKKNRASRYMHSVGNDGEESFQPIDIFK